MWRYVVLNGLWFSMLFLVHFYGTPKSRAFVLFSIAAAAAGIATLPGVDPFAWVFYATASLLVFWGAGKFRLWASARSVAVGEELEAIERRLNQEHGTLAALADETSGISLQADEITHLCDRLKEMSQSLDRLETFLILGEALAKHFKFERLKLVFFEDIDAFPKPESVFQLSWADFQGVFDRSAYKKNPDRARGEIFDFDRMVIDTLSRGGRLLYAAPTEWGAPYMAHPVILQNKLAAAIILTGISEKDVQIFTILTESFAAEIRRLRLYERVQMLATTDGLTGVAVRRTLLERLEGELARSRRMGHKLSFLLIDIDDFKRFNDQCGHLVGDVVLREVADTVRKNIREVDLVGRYGGEEFGVFLIETDEAGALFVAERIRKAIQDKQYRAYDEDLKVTVSIGCSTYAAGQPQDAASIVDTADGALYGAKRAGKNRVHMAGATP